MKVLHYDFITGTENVLYDSANIHKFLIIFQIVETDGKGSVFKWYTDIVRYWAGIKNDRVFDQADHEVIPVRLIQNMQF